MLLKRVLSQYGDKVALEFRHYPLSFHAQAPAAAEAAEAAGEQGKFWEMHDKIFANQANLATINLRDLAQQIGLNMAAYDESIASGRGKAFIAADVAEGNKLGLKWTPYILVNGELWDTSNGGTEQQLRDLIDKKLK